MIDIFSHSSVDLQWWSILVLVAAGFGCGFINVLAGGGSMLSVPALMMMGMPADHANGSNRLSVALLSLAGIKGFDQEGRLERDALLPMMVPTVIGGLSGALLSAWMDPGFLKPALLGAMIAMALAMLIFPDAVSPPEGVQASLRERPVGALMLFGAAFYGGFAQAGVGFLLIGAFAIGLRYDLLRANALKLVCTAVFGAVSLAVFTLAGDVDWIPAMILAVGSVTGATLSTKLAVRIDARLIKWGLFVMVCVASASALIFS